MNNIGVTSLDLLKLCKVISWSWLWVLSPMWGMTIIVIATILILKIKKKRFDRKNPSSCNRT